MEEENKVSALMYIEKLCLNIIISTKNENQEILHKWKKVLVELRAKLGGLDKKFEIGKNKGVIRQTQKGQGLTCMMCTGRISMGKMSRGLCQAVAESLTGFMCPGVS